MCACDFWYQNSQNCKTPVNLILFVTLLGGSVMFVAVFLFVRRYQKRIVRFKAHSNMTERLLDETREELIEMKSVWEIAPQELQIGERINQGSYGDVSRFHIAVARF